MRDEEGVIRSLPGRLAAIPVQSAHSGAINEAVLWYARLRWLAACAATLAVLLSQHVFGLLPSEVTLPLWLGVGAMWVGSVLLPWVCRRYGGLRRCLLCMIVADLLVLTYLLHFSGGIENPLFILYVFHVIIAGILLSRDDAYLVTAVVAALFLLLSLGEYAGLVAHFAPAVFPHEIKGEALEHAAHRLPFVLGTAGAFLLIVAGTAGFAAAMMERLRETQRCLLQSERLGALGQFVAYVAHEVNNPVGIISARVKLARGCDPERASPESLAETLAVVDRQADRIGSVIRSLQSLSRPQRASREPVDVDEALSEALSILSSRLARDGIAVRDERGGALPPVSSRHDDLVHVFLNILTNAADAMPRGGLLRVAAAAGAGGVSVTIADTGFGMSREESSRVFEPFYTTKAAGKGTGLGLPISLALVKALGGDISVESEPSVGTRFEVRLPSRAEESDAG